LVKLRVPQAVCLSFQVPQVVCLHFQVLLPRPQLQLLPLLPLLRVCLHFQVHLPASNRYC
jgi:hypothetical protein